LLVSVVDVLQKLTPKTDCGLCAIVLEEELIIVLIGLLLSHNGMIT
jgi:hypothetical protein